jgi:hypothetical protein
VIRKLGRYPEALAAYRELLSLDRRDEIITFSTYINYRCPFVKLTT